MDSCNQPKNRFCYNYKAEGFIQPCCPPIVSASNQYISSIACTTSVIYGESLTNQGAFLLSKQQKNIQVKQSTLIGNTVQTTIKNTNTITSQIRSQLIQFGQQLYIPYQPYIPPVMPVSVTQLQMASVNVGVPMSFFTMSNCKGNQSLLQSQVNINTPTNIIAMPYSNSASISFTTSIGATYYTVTSSPGNIISIGSASPILVSGLTNGTIYSFIVTGNNPSGASPASTSALILVNPIPSAPKNISVIPSSNTVTLSFTPSLYTLSYTVTSSPGSIITMGSSSPIVISGLTNGTLYTFTITATNASGTSPSSISPSILVNPAPVAPTSLIATPSSGSASISFIPSLYAISYKLTSSPGGISVGGTSSPIIINGLTNGTSYTFAITATNASGTSGSSIPSASVLINPIPSAPKDILVTPYDGSVSVAFTPSLYTIIYTITSSPGGITATGSSSPILVIGLTNGISYTFDITATNASGTSPALTSLPVVVNPIPPAPTNIVATLSSGYVSISFIPSLYATLYIVTASPGGYTAIGTSSPIKVYGLPSGTYSFTIVATNATGISNVSTPSNQVVV